LKNEAAKDFIRIMEDRITKADAVAIIQR
jgi:hypothetical protein